MIRKVLDSGHVYTDDTTLPLQNDDPTRRKTFEAKLWVYAKDNRHGPPLIVYEFSKSRTRDAPLTFLAGLPGLPAGRCLSGLRSAVPRREDHGSGLQCARPPQFRGGGGSAQDARAGRMRRWRSTKSCSASSGRSRI